MNRIISTILIALFLALNSAAQSAAWESKAIGKWDSTDVRKILTDSPWGRTINSGVLNNLSASSAITQGIGASYNLRSALLVRYALIRQLQLEQKYDAMDEKAKLEFDKKNVGLLRCPVCNDYYIVSIRGNIPELKNSALIERNKKQIFLSNEKGEKRYVAKFLPHTFEGSEALFFFPRKGDDGRVLISPDNKKLIFSLVFPDVDPGSSLSLIRHIEINVADIVREGVVVF